MGPEEGTGMDGAEGSCVWDRERGACCHSNAASGLGNTVRQGGQRMHPAGREWAGGKKLQHTQGLFWGELPVCGKDSWSSQSDLAFLTSRGAWPFSMPHPKVLQENPVNTNPAPTPVAVAESRLLLLSRQLQNGVKAQNAVKINNLWSTPSE